MESRVHVWFCRCSEAIWRRPLNCLTKQSHWPTLNLKWWGLNTPHLWLNSCSRHDVINIPSWYELESKCILVLRGISLVWGMQPWLKSQSLPSWASPCPPWAWWARLWSELWSQVMLNLVHGPHRITTMPCSSKCGLDAQDYICEAPIVLRGPELASSCPWPYLCCILALTCISDISWALTTNKSCFRSMPCFSNLLTTCEF